MYTHRELRTAIKAIIESAGFDVGRVYDRLIVVGDQDDLWSAFRIGDNSGKVRGWQFSLAAEETGTGIVPTRETALDSGATQRILGWDVRAVASADHGVESESELEFWDMIEAVQARFRETRGYDPFASLPANIALYHVSTRFENFNGLNIPEFKTEHSMNNGRVHRANCVLYTQFACEVT